MSGQGSPPPGGEPRPPFDGGLPAREKPVHGAEVAAPAGEALLAPPDLPATGPPGPPPSQPPSPPAAPERYPMRYEVAYPARLSRWRTMFRGILAIPVLIFLYLPLALLNAGMAAGWTTVFFRKRYPRWLFAANAGAIAFMARLWAYLALQTDRYPSFDVDSSPVTLDYDEPPQGELSRWRVFFWKAVLLIPHAIVLYFLEMAVAVVLFLAWWAILFTGRYPRGMFAFVTGVTRWHLRVAGYFASFNDRFPPFSLSAEAGPGARASAVICGIVGGLVSGGFVALVVVAAVIASKPHTETVDYALLSGKSGGVAGHLPQGGVRVTASGGYIEVRLAAVSDPGDSLVPLLKPSAGDRVVVFEWTLDNRSDIDAGVSRGDAHLVIEDPKGGRRTVGALMAFVAGAMAPEDVGAGASGRFQAVFVVPKDARPAELRLQLAFMPLGGVRYLFK